MPDMPLTYYRESADRLNRKVLLAVELVDPIAQSLVFRDVTVQAKGLNKGPIISLSGRFVWLEKGGKWPTEISATAPKLPFAPVTVVPPVPPDIANATPAQRLVRITLRPTPAYDFSDGVTAIRGQLKETADPASPIVTDARLQLAWHEVNADKWLPQPPPETQDAATDLRGEFAAFVRLVPTASQLPDVANGLLKVRLQVTRSGATRVTPEDYRFLADPANRGRISEGQLLARDLKLAWADLTAI